MELQDIVRRLRMKQSIKAIKRETGKYRRVIRRVLELAGQEGWLDAQRELPSEHQLQKVYHEQRGGEDGRCHPLDARRDQIEGWRGVEYSETTVRRHIHRHFPPPVRPVMRRETKPGEVMEVDSGIWGSPGMPPRVRGGAPGCSQAGCATSRRHSSRATCTPSSGSAAVIVASFENPLMNRAYRELALHYGFLISPCLPRRPEHKGGVEGDIKYVKRNFLPLFREAEKERGRETPDAGELAEELERWNRESCDQHVVQKVGRTPTAPDDALGPGWCARS